MRHRRFHFTDELLRSITDVYGTGLPDHKWGGCKEVAWMDFVEDVMKAEGSAKTSVTSLAMGAFGGKSRDEDGTVDRVPDPPETLKKWLLTLKRKNACAGVDTLFNLRQQGGHPNGTMKKSQFLICLKQSYKEFLFSDQLIFSIAHAYAIGDPDPEGGKTHVAWRDFCEDIDAQDLKDVTPEIDSYCRAGSAVLG